LIAAHGGPARVLVVDDNAMNRDVLTRRLQRGGHAVEAVEDGESALARLRAQPFDLVLLDVTMPGIDGYEVLARVKADEALRHVPVVMISAIGEAESVVKCLALGADDYLTKPFDPLILKARVDASLSKKRLHDGERRHTQSLEREFEIGRSIQRGFLPESLPSPQGWEIATRFRPARQVAGDFYDVFPLPVGGLGIVVADVCDKGVGAALYMALFRTLLRATACQPATSGVDSAAVLLSAITVTNDYIAQVHGRANMFATVFFCVLDPQSGALRYVNAGHEPPIIAGVGGVRQRLSRTGPALGLLPGQSFVVGTARMQPGECLLGYTDGVVEARGSSGEFGEAALSKQLNPLPASADRLLAAIDASLEEHTAGTEPLDDVTMVAVRRAQA